MAVYTHLSQMQLRDLVEHEYAIGQFVGATGIAAGVSNSNYRLETTQGPYILTLYEHRTNPADLPFFLGLTEHLAARGIACPKPIHRRDGALFGEAGGKAAAIVSFLNGHSREQWTQTHTAEVGLTLAKLHTAAQDFPHTRPNGLGLAGWQELYAALKGTLDSIHPGLETLVGTELDYLSAHWPTGLQPQGVIHADLFPDNVFFEGDAISGVIDFYFACTDMVAYDVAVTINAWCFTRTGEFNAAQADAMLAAYQTIRPLTPEEKAAMPLLLRGAAMRFLMTRSYDWINRKPDALVTPHDPMEYVRKLQFHQRGGWAIA